MSQTNHFFLICISIATNSFLLDVVSSRLFLFYRIWMMGVEIEVLSGEGELTVHR